MSIPAGTLRVLYQEYNGKNYCVEVKGDGPDDSRYSWRVVGRFKTIAKAEKKIARIKAGKDMYPGWSRIYPPPV